MTDTTELALGTGLEPFSDPASVAVVGASNDVSKWGFWLAKGALAGRHRRDVHFVNRGGAAVLGERSVRTVADLPRVPELLALCVPAPSVASVVEAGLDLGVRGFLAITSGLDHEHEIAARIRSGGARLVGANSLGIYDAAGELQLAWGSFTPGPLAIVSQSGQLGSELAILGRRYGLGVSRFISIGNQSDVTAADVLWKVVENASTRVVVVYLESFTDGELLFRVLHDLRVAGKPTILLTLGASAASSRLARSHTGSLTTPIDVIDAACRAAGVARVHTPAEAIDLARASLAAVPMSGVRVAIVGDSGGQCGIAADAVASAGLVVPQLSEALTSQLTQLLPPGAASNNPIDLAGAGERDLRTYARVADQVLRSDEIDGVVLTGYFGSYGLDTPSLAEREADIAAQLCTAAADSGKPLVVHAMTTRSPAVERLWTGGVPVFLTIETASTTVSGLHRLTVIERPDAPLSEAVPPSGSGYWAARAWLETEGVRFPRAHRVRHETALAASMRALRAPYVLKADWLEHKTEAAGVVLDLVGERELRDAFTSMHGRLGDGTYIVEELDTRAAVVEMLVGAHRDPDLGPLIVVGLGGTLAELYRDTAVEMAPVTRTRAITMLRRLRAWPLLTGWRGAPPVDVEGLAGLVATLSRLVAALPDITDIEINPVRVGADGVLAVDALVVRAGADQ